MKDEVAERGTEVDVVGVGMARSIDAWVVDHLEVVAELEVFDSFAPLLQHASLDVRGHREDETLETWQLPFDESRGMSIASTDVIFLREIEFLQSWEHYAL